MYIYVIQAFAGAFALFRGCFAVVVLAAHFETHFPGALGLVKRRFWTMLI